MSMRQQKNEDPEDGRLLVTVRCFLAHTSLLLQTLTVSKFHPDLENKTILRTAHRTRWTLEPQASTLNNLNIHQPQLLKHHDPSQ